MSTRIRKMITHCTGGSYYTKLHKLQYATPTMYQSVVNLFLCLRQYWSLLWYRDDLRLWNAKANWQLFRHIQWHHTVQSGCFHPDQRHSTLQEKPAHHPIWCFQVEVYKSSHFVNSHLFNVDKVGIDELESWQSWKLATWKSTKCEFTKWG